MPVRVCAFVCACMCTCVCACAFVCMEGLETSGGHRNVTRSMKYGERKHKSMQTSLWTSVTNMVAKYITSHYTSAVFF